MVWLFETFRLSLNHRYNTTQRSFSSRKHEKYTRYVISSQLVSLPSTIPKVLKIEKQVFLLNVNPYKASIGRPFISGTLNSLLNSSHSMLVLQTGRSEDALLFIPPSVDRLHVTIALTKKSATED
jgi:hypothetical protein